ncbi:alpha/beta-hydrolase [Corynespora cassiicola Philippines]|uniref:Alpha/beta-hydrolase n=1 Tax=Corynespora cassiicola Philippines TaxID=1448308 RepID=A0A2T2NQA2_CORCC|nr:alpha/beta-hydrolase [Corynespora cassiicola Philippines]
MADFDTTPMTRFDNFDIYTTSYKKIGDHEIEVNVLVPKGVEPGKHPLLVKFHGGGLIYGTALYPDWFAAWFIPFIQRNKAIAVLPNYRLVPESNGDDILQDLADLWKWVLDGELVQFLSSKQVQAEPDFDRLLAAGDSAGGYMALQSGLTLKPGAIKAIVAQYPMTDYLRRDPLNAPKGMPVPPESTIDHHMASVKPGTLVSSARPPERAVLSFALAIYGRYVEFFGQGPHLWPMSAVEKATHLPPTYIVHGDSDTAVSVNDSIAFVDKAKRVLPEAEVRLQIREGADHGFDVELKERDAAWLQEDLKWVESKWLA